MLGLRERSERRLAGLSIKASTLRTRDKRDSATLDSHHWAIWPRGEQHVSIVQFHCSLLQDSEINCVIDISN